MIKLHGKSATTWPGEPFVARLTKNAALPPVIRGKAALIVHGEHSDHPDGFRCYIRFRGKNGDADVRPQQNATLILPRALSYLEDGDVLRVDPERGSVRVLYRRRSRSNSFLLTERCNSDCVMCSQPPRERDDSYLVGETLEAISLIDPRTESLGLTGGEPTLLREDFFRVVQACKNYLPSTALHVLSNGRAFRFLPFSQELGRINHPDLMVGIPVYSDIAFKHDFVVQAQGAFDETIRGILTLGRVGVPVEIRMVLHRFTVDRLPQVARFIARNLTFVRHVALMGLELMGYVKMNLDALWIDPVAYQKQLCDAVAELDSSHINVSIYNHQFCLLDRELWRFAVPSISDWKNEYVDACSTCAVQRTCGGFFASSRLRVSDHVRAIDASELTEAEAVQFGGRMLS